MTIYFVSFKSYSYMQQYKTSLHSCLHLLLIIINLHILLRTPSQTKMTITKRRPAYMIGRRSKKDIWNLVMPLKSLYEVIFIHHLSKIKKNSGRKKWIKHTLSINVVQRKTLFPKKSYILTPSLTSNQPFLSI